jgi:hypothetical protein
MSDPKLSILCVTKAEHHAPSFLSALEILVGELHAQLIVAADGVRAEEWLVHIWGKSIVKRVDSGGYIESVLDQALDFCEGEQVLRLDDDERCSPAMIRWLQHGSYENANHWKFPRIHLWGDTHHALVTRELWPDHQTRLSSKRFASGRSDIHSGSPHGGGLEAPCAIEHHKFLVRSLEERRAIVERYDRIQPGAGSCFRAFNCPEDVYAPDIIKSHTRMWDGEELGKVAA